MFVVFPFDHIRQVRCSHQGKVGDVSTGLQDKRVQWRVALKEGGCNMQQIHCAQSPLVETGRRVTASQITQLTKISYGNVNPWGECVGDGRGRFEEITYCTLDTSVWSSSWVRRRKRNDEEEGVHTNDRTAFVRGSRQKCWKIQWGGIYQNL